MSVESPEALERSVLESKDREQLLAIASALGVKANSRTKKGDIIDRILDQVRGESPAQGGGSNGNGHPDEATSVLDEVVSELAEAVDAAEAGTEPEPEPERRAGEPDVATTETSGVLEVVPSPPDLSDEPLAEWELAFHGDDAHPEARLGSETGTTASETSTDGGSEARQGDGQAALREDGQGGGRRRRRRNRDRNRADGPQGLDRAATEVRADEPQEHR